MARYIISEDSLKKEGRYHTSVSEIVTTKGKKGNVSE